jgi:hypothetical protein
MKCIRNFFFKSKKSMPLTLSFDVFSFSKDNLKINAKKIKLNLKSIHSDLLTFTSPQGTL